MNLIVLLLPIGDVSCGGSERKRNGIDNGCKTAWTKWTFKNKANEQKQIYIL